MKTQVGIVMLIALVSTTALSGCGNGDDACEEAFESAALSVDEVATANFSCTSSFEHDGQNGSITLSVDTEEDALPVIDEVYQKFASSSDLKGALIANVNFFLAGAETTDPENIVDESDLGIRNSPLISELRDHYGIHPAGVS